MAQQFDYPKNETDLRDTLDALYLEAKTAKDGDERPSFGGLIELMSSEVTIKTAIHNIKANRGSETPGVDGWKMQRDYLQKPYEWVIEDIQKAFGSILFSVAAGGPRYEVMIDGRVSMRECHGIKASRKGAAND